MTEQIPEPVETPPFQVVPGEADRLATLHAAYADAKAAADEAGKRLSAIKDAIKLELTQRAPEGSTRIDLAGDAGPALRLSWKVSHRLDTNRLKSEQPAIYTAYVKASGSWELKSTPGAGATQ